MCTPISSCTGTSRPKTSFLTNIAWSSRLATLASPRSLAARARPTRAEKSLATGPPIAPGSTGSRTTSARCRGVPRGPARPAIPPPLSSVYTWGGGLSAPLRLPMLNTEVVQVATGRTQKAGVTRSGRLILWEAPPLGGGGGALLPGAVEQQQPQFISRFLEGQSGVTIKHVACGDLFTACLTDRGIIMTFGSGSNGCLGHGSLNDISQPTIVEALLGYEMVQVACGASHVLALSTERELFAWGRGDGGRLGLGTRESYNCPQQVPMPPGQEAQRVVCGIDSSMILTVPGRVLACGSNRFNKLGLDHLSLGEEPAPHQQVEEVLSFTPLCSAPLDQETLLSVDLGTAHSAAVTASGDCYTFGSNQHGQLGTNARRVSRAPCQVQGLQGIKIAMVACGDAFTVAIGAEGEVYSWGKGARGRLGRRDEDAGLPRPVQLDETHPYTVTSVSCCHGNTLLAVRLNALRAQLALSWKPDLTLGSRVVFRDLTGKGWRWVWLHPDPAPPPAWLENASLVPSGTAAQCFGAGQGGACLEGHSSGHSSGLACALPGAGRSGGAALTPPPTLCHSSETGWGKGNWLDQTSFQMTGSSANKNISCLPA
ncbi:serine/threonine-protein kinase Nek8 isoform X10 [Myotis lucifugus]|uniref:serine/threonine-protein kinase Nek8 isoform X10 n=1 Tax=Myotis lucifugus TaxID=59463 RepID=UPI000CCC459A|nr:serine/threonine-protein kinase Nek8 isoform X10 [Myotis lucifugus]